MIDEVLELFLELDASDEQLDCPFVYASAKGGYAVLDLDEEPKNMVPLFETILNYIPAPQGDETGPTQVLISTIDYNEYVGASAWEKWTVERSGSIRRSSWSTITIRTRSSG